MSTIFRTYRYSDPNKGWGDSGTFSFHTTSKNFSEEELKSSFGNPSVAIKWFYENMGKYDMSIGVEIITKERLQEYIEEMTTTIEHLESLRWSAYMALDSLE